MRLRPQRWVPGGDFSAVPLSHTCGLAVWLQDVHALCLLSPLRDSAVLKITSLVDDKFCVSFW